MVTLYRNTTDYTLPFDTAARQIQVTCINQNFKKNSVTFRKKKNAQESLQVVPFCSQAVPSALHLRSESLPYVTSSKGHYFRMDRYYQGDHYFRGLTIGR